MPDPAVPASPIVELERAPAWCDPAMMVVVVVGEVGGERSGCLVGFHSQCSIDPPRYAVWISRENHTFLLAKRARSLDLHLMSRVDRAVAEVFGALTGDEVDKWEELDRRGLTLGSPQVSGAIVAVLDEPSCDHVAFVLEPHRDGAPTQPPLRASDVGDLRAGHGA